MYPALAVADALREREQVDFLFIGVKGRMDEQIVAKARMPFETISARPLRAASPTEVAKGALSVVAGTAQAWRILRRFGPDAVFATGGYASVPVAFATKLRRRPLVVYLPDVQAGWAVRLLSWLAARIAATAERSLNSLPSAKTSVTGYPVREAFGSTDRHAARARLRLPPDATVLLISGASQGAHRINVAVSEQLDALLDLSYVVHLTGRSEEGEMLARRDSLPAERRERYHVYGYLEEMADAMAAADLAVLRAGASVLGELPAAGLPAVLVPGEYEGGHTQWPNARYLEAQGAAITLANDRLAELSAVVAGLLADTQRLASMGEAARRLARPDAARRIASLVMEAAA